jgi:hypothetical protein
MPAREGRKWSAIEERVANDCKRRAVRVRVATGGGDVVRRRLRENMSGSKEGIPCGRVWRRWSKLVHGQLVGRGFDVRIVTAVCDGGVANNRCNGSCSVGRLRVQADVDERHLLQDEREGIGGGNDRAMLRAEVREIGRRNTWRVDRASFRRHFDGGRNKRAEKQAAVKTASRTCA